MLSSWSGLKDVLCSLMIKPVELKHRSTAAEDADNAKCICLSKYW